MVEGRATGDETFVARIRLRGGEWDCVVVVVVRSPSVPSSTELSSDGFSCSDLALVRGMRLLETGDDGT